MFHIINKQKRFPVLLLLIAAAALSPAVADDSDARFERFLSRLGLTDLHIVHMEERVQHAADDTARLPLARRLADLYAHRLLTSGDEKEKFADILRRVNSLIRKVPLANTPGLQVMLLQADFSRAESLMNKWMDDRQDSTALGEAREILARIGPELKLHFDQLSKRVDTLLDELGAVEDDKLRESKQQELDHLDPVVNQAAFFTGWSNYFLGVSRHNNVVDKVEFTTAQTAFRRILGITDEESYKEVNAEWLILSNDKRAQALIGLGLTEVALGNLTDSRICFQLLDHVSTPPAIRDRGAFWYLRGLLNASRLAEAIAYAGDQVEKFSGGATAGKSMFCVTLVTEAYAGGNPSAEQRRLGELGIRGLARLRRTGLIRELMKKHMIEVADDAGFYLTWIKGEQEYFVAQSSGKEGDYQSASNTLAKALTDPDARADIVSAGKCRHYLALCRYHLKEYEKAAQDFQQTSLALKEADQRTAIESAWNAYLCYRQLLKNHKRFLTSAIDSLRSIKREFPGSEEAKKADYHLAKLAANPKEMIRSLSVIKPNDPSYLMARFELCGLYHQKWAKARSDPDTAPAAAKAVRDAVDTYLRAAKSDANDQRKLRALLLAADVALHSQPAEATTARGYLTRAKPFADALPQSSTLLEDYHFRLFEVAKSAGDNLSIQRHANWLLDNAAGSSYERAVIISLAIASDKAVKSATGDERRKRLEAATRVYLRLVQLQGDSKEVLTNSKNARVAVSKLAAYESQLGYHAQATKRLESLLEIAPKDTEYLRRTAKSGYLAGQFQQSVERWRLLLAGLPKASEPWYEAKHYQLKCLARLDRSKAQEVYKQFKLLHPDIKVDSWRSRFEQLEKELQ